MSTHLHGIAASDGIAIGPVFRIEQEGHDETSHVFTTVEEELALFSSAVNRAMEELRQFEMQAMERLGREEAQIFLAHQQMLEDPSFSGEVQAEIRKQKSASQAIRDVSETLIQMFQAMPDDYLRERATDIADLRNRLLRHVTGTADKAMDAGVSTGILVAADLTPSDTIALDANRVVAFVTEVGGRTSHSAILARSLGLPAVVAVSGLLSNVGTGDVVIVDGAEGKVVIQPTEEELADYTARAHANQAARAKTEENRFQTATTKDGRSIEVAGNIGTPNDVTRVLEHGGDGVGLYRTEFLFMNRESAPTEEEQFEAYRSVAASLEGKPLVIRTLDVGGDKEIPYLNLPVEQNPFLGYRAVRFCLDEPALFQTQLRAILRASHYGNVKVMFPMISTVSEIRAAKAALEEAKVSLASAGVPFREDMEVGMMVEIPASAVAADRFAKEVDFFSIGTNDLVQYTMACDRMNERISHLYQPYHPAVLRLVKNVIEAAHNLGKWVGMCGEMAGEDIALPLLLGLGLDEFSMSAGSIPQIKQLATTWRYTDAQQLAEAALQLDTQEEVEQLVRRATSS